LILQEGIQGQVKLFIRPGALEPTDLVQGKIHRFFPGAVILESQIDSVCPGIKGIISGGKAAPGGKDFGFHLSGIIAQNLGRAQTSPDFSRMAVTRKSRSFPQRDLAEEEAQSTRVIGECSILLKM
jgi:uncharacterized membrane protein YdfJ with MMPL/SSD domain